LVEIGQVVLEKKLIKGKVNGCRRQTHYDGNSSQKQVHVYYITEFTYGIRNIKVLHEHPFLKIDPNRLDLCQISQVAL